MVFVFTICRQYSPLEVPATNLFISPPMAMPCDAPSDSEIHTSNGWGPVRFHKRFTDASDFLPSEGEPPRTATFKPSDGRPCLRSR